MLTKIRKLSKDCVNEPLRLQLFFSLLLDKVASVKNSLRHPLPVPPSRRPRLGRHVFLPRLGREVEVEHCCRSRSRVGSSHKRSGSLEIG